MLCCCLTKKGSRCKRNSTILKIEQGYYIHKCRQHENTTCIDKWRDKVIDEEYLLYETPETLKHMFSMMLYFYKTYGWSRTMSIKVSEYTWYDFLHLEFDDNLNLSCSQVDKVFIKRFLQKNFHYELEGKHECPICYDTFDSTIKTSCGHIFCENCITKTLYNMVTCPMCRSEIVDISELKDV